LATTAQVRREGDKIPISGKPLGDLGELASTEKPLPSPPEIGHSRSPPLVVVTIALRTGAVDHPDSVMTRIRLGESLKGNAKD
jgi:hypothetical protein